MCYNADRDDEKIPAPEKEREVEDLRDDEREELVRLIRESGLIMVKRKDTEEQQNELT